MSRVLIAYATMAGSTAEVARAVAEELESHGLQVDLQPVEAVASLAGYDAIVVGGPMIMGWHRAAQSFLRRHRAALRRIPLAVFVLAMSATEAGPVDLAGVPVYVDPKLPKPPVTPGRLSFRERYALLTHYARPIVAAARPAVPASLAFLGGRLEYGRLKWWAVLFAMLVIQAPATDRRNWAAIRDWAASLPEALGLHTLEPTIRRPEPAL